MLKNGKWSFSFAGPDVLQTAIYAALTHNICIRNTASTQGTLKRFKTQPRTRSYYCQQSNPMSPMLLGIAKKSCILKDYILGLSSKLTTVSS